MNTKTKEGKITSKLLRKGGKSLYLHWENKPILTEYQFARALWYTPISEQNIDPRNRRKKDNRMKPIFLLLKKIILRLKNTHRTIYEKYITLATHVSFKNSLKSYSSYNKQEARIFLLPDTHIETIKFITITFLSFFAFFIWTILILSQKTHAFVEVEIMEQNQPWLWVFIIPAIFLFWIGIYVLRFIVSHKREKRSENKENNHYDTINNNHSNKLRNKIRKILFYTISIPILFIGRIIKRALIHNEGFMNIFLRNYILNPFHNWLLLNGLYDRLSSKNSFTHSLVVAKTWLWKTSTYIIPNLLTLDNCSILTVDLSWELYEKTSWAMKQKWYDIKIINPTNLKISEKYNPLEFVKEKNDISEISHILVFFQGNVQWDEFWNNGAMNLIGILISCLVCQREKLKKNGIKNYTKFCTLSQLRYLLNNFWEGGKWLDNFVSTYADYETYHDWKGFISWCEETTQGFVINALTSLNIIGNKEVAILTSKNDIDFKKIREKKTIYYLQVPWHLIHIYAPLISIFYTQFFSSCMEKLPNKKDLDVYALIDEAWHIKIWSPIFFSTMITNIRKYRVSISLIVQNLSQMETLYWDIGANTVIHGGIATQIYFWGCDVKTCEMIEKLMGTITIKNTDYLWNTTYTKEPLRTIFQIRTMLNNEAILIYSNKKPVMLYMKPYYKHSILKNLSELKPIKIEKENEDKNKKLHYMDLKNIDTCWEIWNIWEKNELEITEDEIDELSNNPDFSENKMSQEQYQNYMDGEEQPIFDVRCLDEKTRTLIDLVKEKVIYCHLNKSFDDISIPMRFQIKKRVKKLMDLPNYFERLNFIRNSVCGEIDIRNLWFSYLILSIFSFFRKNFYNLDKDC